MSNEQKAIGKAIDELTKRYCELYDAFQGPDYNFISDKAHAATLDLWVQIYIYTESLENVEAYIKSCTEKAEASK